MNGLARFFLLSSVCLITIGLGGAYERAVKGELVVMLAGGGVILGLISFIFGMGAALIRGSDGDSTISSYLAIFYGLAIIAGAAVVYVMFVQRFPRINDVTTDVKNPPEFRGKLPPFETLEGQEYVKAADTRLYDWSFAPLQLAGYPDIKPQKLAFAPDIAYRAAVKTAAGLGWQLAVSDPKTRHFEAESESENFHFIDDVAVDVRAGDQGESVVEVRSRSRVGEFDFGMNAEHIQQFLGKLGPNLKRVQDSEEHKTKATASPPAAPVGSLTAPAAPAAAPAPTAAKPETPTKPAAAQPPASQPPAPPAPKPAAGGK